MMTPTPLQPGDKVWLLTELPAVRVTILDTVDDRLIGIRGADGCLAVVDRESVRAMTHAAAVKASHMANAWHAESGRLEELASKEVAEAKREISEVGRRSELEEELRRKQE